MAWLERTRFLYRAWRYRWAVERDPLRFLMGTLKSGQTAVDIGSHKGAYSYWMRRAVGTKGKVISFEPQPELARYLEDIRRSFRCKNLNVENLALSSSPGEMLLTRSSSRPSPGASLRPPRRGAGQSFMVAVETVDRYFARQPGRPISLIKCDVEGHELDVFLGADDVLRQDRPILLFECERRHHDDQEIDSVFGHLRSLGYTGSFFLRGRVHPIDAFRPHMQANPDSADYVNNFVFVPEEKASRPDAA